MLQNFVIQLRTIPEEINGYTPVPEEDYADTELCKGFDSLLAARRVWGDTAFIKAPCTEEQALAVLQDLRRVNPHWSYRLAVVIND